MAKKTPKSPKRQSNNDEVKNIRLTIPIDIYRRLKKYQARKILQNKPELSLQQVCIELLDTATRRL